MKFTKFAQMHPAQDGAIWGKYLFRFGSRGECVVYRLDEAGLAEIYRFYLDRASELAPHSNAVCFGTEYYAPEDEFPLLYTNIYNNYSACRNRMEGVCCVYRVTRDGETFTSELVQLVEIGFVRDPNLWCSGWEQGDVRPYGNFAVDRDTDTLWAFTMRDEANTTRYFSFRLPRLAEGETDSALGVRKVTLTGADILRKFDTPYHRYLQGACIHAGKLYSVEGFSADTENPPALRIIDLWQEKQIVHANLEDYGLTVEPEFIDFQAERCIYSDAEGSVFLLDLDG